MTIENLVVWLLIGAIAGWLAGVLTKRGFGLVGNIVVGIVGAVFGTWLFPRIGITIGAGFISQTITATMGAVILLFVASLLGRRK